jgi:hypothetical protein
MKENFVIFLLGTFFVKLLFEQNNNKNTEKMLNFFNSQSLKNRLKKSYS